MNITIAYTITAIIPNSNKAPNTGKPSTKRIQLPITEKHFCIIPLSSSSRVRLVIVDTFLHFLTIGATTQRRTCTFESPRTTTLISDPLIFAMLIIFHPRQHSFSFFYTMRLGEHALCTLQRMTIRMRSCDAMRFAMRFAQRQIRAFTWLFRFMRQMKFRLVRHL
jgi:hypothetical protein